MPIDVIIKTLFIVLVVVAAFAPVITWVERKQSAVMQDRIGANRANIGGITILGLLHPLADVLKLITKEDFVPAGANRFLHALAPVIAAIPAIIGFAVIPYGATYQFPGFEPTTLVAADIDWGLLYIFAIGSIATYGSVLAGWSSNNKYSLIGAMRSGAQIISYELSVGLSLLTIIVLAGTMQFSQIVEMQSTGWFIFKGHIPAVIAFLIFLIASTAETNRGPFDLAEAESEL
ncbi:MAG: NADH-quinone oxidoreductase subunit H, partial [Acidimicrobiia bacterium]|nr:NADH-quinone oxidoreductase subunit H [Acidimicrobiia bacterium]